MQDNITTPSNDILDAPEITYELYTKRAIYIFGILFSILFGAALLSKNLQTLGKKKELAQLWLIAAAYFIAEIIAIIYIQRQHVTGSFNFLLSLGGGLILSNFLYPRYMPADTEFKKKSIVVPLIIGLCIVAVFVLIYLLPFNL